jgi:glycosyltransferase involved in cell wall biosynthesis
VQRLPLRRLVTGPAPSPERVFLTSVWFKGHNNPRYAELLPRLRRLDAYLVTCSDRRIPRGLQFRAYRWGRAAHYRATLAAATRRYGGMLTLDNEQIRWFGGPIVSDVDDPRFTEAEVALLRRPNLRAYVVTAEHAARRFAALGVEKPHVVIPQGVSLRTISEPLVAEARKLRREGDVVVGYMAAFLLSAGDRGGESPLYNVDHLLELWNEVHARAPAAQLWLVGDASERVRRRLAGRDDVVVFGLLPRERALTTLAGTDLALYPRTQDQGIRAAKVAEYLGLGLPIVSYDYDVTQDIREAGAGLLVDTPRAFVDAAVSLVQDDALRASLAAAARTAGEARDWDVLARHFEEVLDLHLPPGRR